jgi:hypothetical protein
MSLYRLSYISDIMHISIEKKMAPFMMGADIAKFMDNKNKIAKID